MDIANSKYYDVVYWLVECETSTASTITNTSKKWKWYIYEEKQRVKSTIEQRFGTQLYTNKLKLTSTLNRAKFQYKSKNTHIQWITAILFSVLTYLTCATSSVYGYVAIFLRKHHHYQIWFSSILREICVAMTCVTSNLLICQTNQ